MEIKIFDKSDLNEIFHSFYKLFLENTRGHAFPDQHISELYIKQKANELLDYLQNGTAIFFGAMENSDLAGFLWAYPRIFFEEKRIYINSLIVSEKYRGRGIGGQLADEFEKYALKHGFRIIDVATASFKTDAIRFYEKRGYVSERIQFRKVLKKK